MTSRALAVATLLMIAAAASPARSLADSNVVAHPVRPELAARLRSYATVSRHADGTTTVTSVSAELRALLEEEYAEGKI